MTLDDAIRRMKGAVGTHVTLTVVHPSREPQGPWAEKSMTSMRSRRIRAGIHRGLSGPQTVTLTREMIHVETVMGDHRGLDDRWDFMLDHDKKIGYVRVNPLAATPPAICGRLWNNFVQ